jgi:hypothetical protein
MGDVGLADELHPQPEAVRHGPEQRVQRRRAGHDADPPGLGRLAMLRGDDHRGGDRGEQDGRREPEDLAPEPLPDLPSGHEARVAEDLPPPDAPEKPPERWRRASPAPPAQAEGGKQGQRGDDDRGQLHRASDSR